VLNNWVVAAITIHKMAHVAVVPEVKIAPLPDVCQQRVRDVHKRL